MSFISINLSILNSKVQNKLDKGAKKQKKVEDQQQSITEEKKGKLKKEENIENLKKDKQTKILRDKNLPQGKEKSVGEVSSKTGKYIKKEQDISDTNKMTTSNIDNKENFEIKLLLRGTIPKKRKEISKVSIEKERNKLQAEHLKELEAKKEPEEAERKANNKKLKMKNKILKTFPKSKQAQQAFKKNPFDIDPKLIKSHKCVHNTSGQRSSVCTLCLDSEFELDVLSLDNKRNIKKDKIKDKIIIGERVYKQKSTLEKTIKPKDELPIIFFEKDLYEESDQAIKMETKPIKKKIEKGEKEVVMGSGKGGKGLMRYALSDRTYIDKGWTMLPSEKILRKMNVYRMRPAHPEFDWFEHNRNKGLMTYDTGEKLADFDENSRGRWYYRSGQLALDYYDAKETAAQQRFVVYSSGEPDERGRTHPITILATFDYLGNGIVYDHAGKIRLKYNQTEGVVLDRAIGPVSHWQWHSLNDPPVLQHVMIDTQMAIKDPDILRFESLEDKITQAVQPEQEEMLAIEFDNFVKDKSKKLSQKFKPFQIKMKALKINKYFSLKVLGQSTVYLIFRDGLTNLKVNIGMILDNKEIVDTDTSELGKVMNSLERYPARTDSLESLQRRVANAHRYEKQYVKRQHWLRPPGPCASADLQTAATSPPLRLPLISVPTASSSTTGYCSKKLTNNLYCNTHLPC